MVVYLRPSNEALLRVRVPRAQDPHGGPSHPVSRARAASKEGIWPLPPLVSCAGVGLDATSHGRNGFPQNVNHASEFRKGGAKWRHEDHDVADRA